MKYNIKGKIIDSNSNSSLLGVKITYNSNTVTTDTKGGFIIKGELEDGEKITLLITKENYNPLEIIPYMGDGTIKTNLNTIKLSSNISNLESEKSKLIGIDNDLVKTISKPDGLNGASQKTLNRVINNLKSLLIPTVLTLISSFGVTNISKLLKDPSSPITPQCPSPEKLKELIIRRNKLAKQLDNLYKVVDTATQAITLLQGIIISTKVAFTILKFLPIPTPPPTLPSLVPPIQDLKPILKENIDKFSKINSGTLLILLILKNSIQQILDLLSILDKLIQGCSTNSDSTLDEINKELLNINKIQNEENPPQQPINGFTFDIETENTNNTLKRKRAVAKNKQGVILLKGEYSYSAGDKVLIDELVFYIQQNNLKAD